MSEDVKKTLELARSFAMKCYFGNSGFVPEDYFILQISKFILLKEKIIKKKNDTSIKFDIKDNYLYIASIKEMASYIREHSTKLSLDGISVCFDLSDDDIRKEGYDPISLKEDLIIIQRLRNALAHGNYSLDISNGLVHVNNVLISNGVDASIVCDISIETLEQFSYIENGILNNNDENFIEDILCERALYNYFDRIKLNKTNKIKNNYLNKDFILKFQNDNNIQINNYDYYDVQNINRNISNIQVDTNDIFNIKEDVQNTGFDIYKYNIVKKNLLKELRDLLRIIYNSSFSEQAKSRIFDSLRKYGIKSINGDEISLAKIELNKLKQIIDEIRKILKLHGKSDIKVVAIYNYLQILFANYTYSDNEMFDLNLSGIRFKFMNKIEEINFNNESKKLRDSINKIGKRIKNNENKNGINDLILPLKESLINYIIKSKRTILNRIRNAVLHGNIEISNKSLSFSDRSDQTSDEINFECSGDIDCYYEAFGISKNQNKSSLWASIKQNLEFLWPTSKGTIDNLNIIINYCSKENIL